MGERWGWAAWSMLAGFVVCLVGGVVLALANGTFQQDAGNQFLLVVGLSVFVVVGPWWWPIDLATRSAGSSRPSPCSR